MKTWEKSTELYRIVCVSTLALSVYRTQIDSYDNIRQYLALAFKVKYTVVKEKI